MSAVPRSHASIEEMERILEKFQALVERHPAQPIDRPAVIRAYEQALDALGVAYAEHFRRIFRNDAPAAWTEAITWQFFRQLGWAASRYEDPSHGGPDFVFHREGQQILIECTCLTENSLNAASGLDLARFTSFQGYGSIAPRVLATVAGKTKQIGNTGFPGPRILVIAIHDATFPYLHASLAEDLVAETEKISVPMGAGIEAAIPVTTLAGSTLFRPGTEGIEAARHSISGILLMNAGGTAAHMCGILNPHALYPLQPESLPQVPWLTVTNQPTDDLAVAMSWIWLDQSQVSILPNVRELMLAFDGSAILADMTVFPREDCPRGDR